MIKNKKVIAIIPARGGSKRILGKNIKLMAGKPLLYWVARAVKASKYIDEIYVSTEDSLIKQTSLELGLGLKIIDRPAELAQDTTPEELVHLHAMKKIPFDILVIAHATNPLTAKEDFDRALEKFLDEKHDSMVTGTLHKRFYWTIDGKPLNYNPLKRPRTQDFKGTFTENGAFYITKSSILKKHRNFLAGKIGVHEMSPEKSIDIDDEKDWLEAEKLLKKYKKHEL